MLLLVLASLLTAPPVLPDHLEPVTGVWADPTGTHPDAAFHRLLLKHPIRELQLVTQPAFDFEEVVYVTSNGQGGLSVVYATFVGPTKRQFPMRLLPDASPQGRAPPAPAAGSAPK